MNDWEAVVPLWGDRTAAERLLSADLTERLEAWAAQFNQQCHYQRGWIEEAVRCAHKEQGTALFEDLQLELAKDDAASWRVEWDSWECELEVVGEECAARLEMAQDLQSIGGHSVELCVHALEIMRDDLDRALSWLTSPAATRWQQQQHQEEQQEVEPQQPECEVDRSQYDEVN